MQTLWPSMRWPNTGSRKVYFRYKTYQTITTNHNQRNRVNKTTTFTLSSLILMNSLLFLSCSSTPKKADIPNTANPQEEITKLEYDLNSAVTKNIDVLAPKEFLNATKWLTEAQSDIAAKENQEEVLDDLRKGRGYLQAAYAVSENRSEKAPSLFEARQNALQAGAGKHSELRSDLQNLDEEVGSEAGDLINLNASKIAKLQDRYMDLEKRATILSQLGNAQAMFNGAKKEDAKKFAPLTFKKTEMSLKNAEAVIATNSRNPVGYRPAVNAANADAALLNEVMSIIKQNDEKLPETAALKLVSQSGKINALNNDLANTNAENSAASAALEQKNTTLNEELIGKDQDLRSANAGLQIQQVIENARMQFSPEEAEAYQQGESLVIRLKQISFASGRTELPGASLAVLAKVSTVAKSMNANQIKIEGHTDSIGTEVQNKLLSEKRAGAVAAYFKSNGFDEVTSEGFGFQKPLSTNKSKEGRAQNRRVDIILTPEKASVTK